MAALGVEVEVRGADGATRTIPLHEFYRRPGATPDIETGLEPGDLITAVTLPPPLDGTRQVYRKVRDRASYAFALVSVAAAVGMEGDKIGSVALAFGSVAPHPWTDDGVAEMLRGEAPSDDLFRAAAERLAPDAAPHPDTEFKRPLLRRSLIAALRTATGLSEGDPVDTARAEA